MKQCITCYQDFQNCWALLKNATPLHIEYKTIQCKYCGSRNVIKYGHFKDRQKLWCKDCRHKFSDNDNSPHMKTPDIYIKSAIGLYWEGLSVNAIRRQMYQEYNYYPSASTIYEWVEKIARKSFDEFKHHYPRVGDTWIIYETPLKIGSRNAWLVDIIDPDTRFLIATRLFYGHRIMDIKELLETAQGKALKIPQKIFTGGWKGYNTGIELAWGSDIKHVITSRSDKRINKGIKEWWQPAVKDRMKALPRLKTEAKLLVVLERWTIHYNYYRVQGTLDNKTPAEKAGIKYQIQR
jgi:transposase-like protein/DNA-directed RNA polymerase subunit RPC12/RpoP